VIRLGPLRLRLRLGHIGALLGLAVPASTGAVVHVTVGIDPNLAVAGRCGSGAPGCGGRWRGQLGRRIHRDGGCFSGTPRLHAAMAAAGAGALGTGEGCAVLAGRCDRTCALRLGGAFGGGRVRGRLDRRTDHAARLRCRTP